MYRNTCTGQEAGPSKTINQIKLADFGPGPRNKEDISTLSWDDKKKKVKGTRGKGPTPQGNKCFNCGQEGHGIKNCRKLMNQCNKCKFHGGRHRVNCSKYVARVHATTTEQATAHSPPSVPKDLFTAI